MSGQATITDVIFDFCGVLVDWRCSACLQGHYPEALVERIGAEDDPYGFFHYEDRMDAGENFRDLIVDYRRDYGDDMAEVFTYYIRHYDDALPRLVPGMSRLLADLRALGIGAWGLTNWSHETFHVAFEKFPELAASLQGTVVSGVEKLHKPDAAIYELALRRFGLEAEHCAFFDDTAKNVAGARAVGIHGLLFTDAGQAREQLRGLGLKL